ncbi:hypothetical protein Tco_1002934 [Tanacetum coccineum]|uniref:Transposase (Putative), gypsy type n=1 Tax=Tanacetum coccineum TaxID=301880 RepID=A0ABQ5F7N1_9ASTR
MRERSIITYVRFAVSGLCQYGTGLSSGPLYFSYFSCLVGPGVHCDNAVQARRPGEAWVTWPLLGLSHSDRFDCSVNFALLSSLILLKILAIDSEVMATCNHLRVPLPLSTFLVDVLRYFRINISQLSVIRAAKVDEFACPASFPWHTAKNFIRDLALLATEFNARDYTTLVANPSPFRKFPKPFLCLVGISRYYMLDENTYPLFLHKNGEDIDLFAFIHTSDPTKVKIAEHERGEDERSLLETTVGHIVPLLLVAPACSDGELDMSIDKLFDEGCSGDQTEHKDSANGGQGANIQPVCEVTEVVPVPQRRYRKRKIVVTDGGEPSHPAKKVKEDQGMASRPTVGGKSMSAVQRLIAKVVLNAKVRVTAATTIPFVASSVSTTPERKGRDHIDSLAGLNLHSIGAAQRFVISSNSSHHSGTNIVEVEVDSFARTSISVIITATVATSTVDPTVAVKENVVKPSLFSTDSTLAGGTDPAMGGFTDLTDSDFLVGGIRTVINPDSDLQKVYVP